MEIIIHNVWCNGATLQTTVSIVISVCFNYCCFGNIVCVGVGVPHWPSGYSVCWCGSSSLAFRI